MPPRVGVLVAVVFWGLSFVATKAAVRELSPAGLIFARAGLGTLLLALILLARREPLVPPRDSWRALATMGFVGVAFHQLLQAYALRLTTAGNAGWLVSLTPVWSALLAALTLGERFGPLKLLGLAAGFAGALLVVTQGSLAANLIGLPATRGDLMILASTLNWAVYSVLGHAVLRRLGPRRATAGALFFGWLFLCPLFLGSGSVQEFRKLSATGWVAVLFLGVACSGLGYLFWYGALERIEASRVAAFLYLEPLITLAAAASLLGEPIRTLTVLGGLLLLGGVFLVQWAPLLPARAARVGETP